MWSLKKFSRNDRGKMFTARPRRTRTYRKNNRDVNKQKINVSVQIRFKKNKRPYYAPDDKGDFKLMREAENGEAEERKHTRLWRQTFQTNNIKTQNLKTK